MVALRAFFCMSRRLGAMCLVVILVVALAGTATRRIGDHLQVALPVMAFGCEVLNGRGADYALRFAVLMVGIHGTKFVLGDAPPNMRPNGKGHGFPSGHTAAATFGAHALVRSCVMGSPLGQAVAVIAAGFTGGSRIEAGAHTLWQVLAGAIWGLACDVGFRRRRLRPVLFSLYSAVRHWLGAWRVLSKGRSCSELRSPVFP